MLVIDSLKVAAFYSYEQYSHLAMSQLTILSIPGSHAAKYDLVLLTFPNNYGKKCRRDIYRFNNLLITLIWLTLCERLTAWDMLGWKVMYPDGVLSYNTGLKLSYPVVGKPSTSILLSHFYITHNTSDTRSMAFSPHTKQFCNTNWMSYNLIQFWHYLGIASDFTGWGLNPVRLPPTSDANCK